jgi:hypothetical protein
MSTPLVGPEACMPVDPFISAANVALYSFIAGGTIGFVLRELVIWISAKYREIEK